MVRSDLVACELVLTTAGICAGVIDLRAEVGVDRHGPLVLLHGRAVVRGDLVACELVLTTAGIRAGIVDQGARVDRLIALHRGLSGRRLVALIDVIDVRLLTGLEALVCDQLPGLRLLCWVIDLSDERVFSDSGRILPVQARLLATVAPDLAGNP